MNDWIDELSALGIELSQSQRTQFDRYLALLLDWNTRMNLTAVREPGSIQMRHFYDSLTCAQATLDLNQRSLIDVGTGAGFPGVPLKILFPDLKLTLVESIGKKAQFLEALVLELALTEVQVFSERAELLGQDGRFRAMYDWAVGRGVAEMRVLAELLLPFCRVGGKMLAQKGENAKIETASAQNALQLLGGSEPQFTEVRVPDKETPHYLVTIEKIKETPQKYPRRVGLPGKRPL